MVTYGTVFEDNQYIAVAKKAAKYYQESAKSALIPLIVTDLPDALEYRHLVLTNPNASSGVHEWSEEGAIADVEHGYTDFDLEGIECRLKIPNDMIAKFRGNFLIADKREAILEKWALDVDDAIFHGVKDRTGTVKLCKGLIDQTTCIEDISQAGTGAMSTKGDIWYGISKMIDAIPFALRESSPDMLLYMTENIYKDAKAPDRIYNDKIEYDFIMDVFMGEKASKGRKISNIIITNKILAIATDDTEGDGADAADTVGTNARMMLIVPDPKYVARVVSTGFALIGEEKKMLSIRQLWGWRGAPCLFNTSAVQYTEQLTL